MAEKQSVKIGADAKEFNRAFQQMGKEVDKFAKASKQMSQQGMFSKAKIREVELGMVGIGKSIRDMGKEYKNAGRAIKEMEQENARLYASGQKINAQRKEELALLRARRKELKASISQNTASIAGSRAGGTGDGIAFGNNMNHMDWGRASWNGARRMGRWGARGIGGVARGMWGLGKAGVVGASAAGLGAVGWAVQQGMAGVQTLTQNQAARTGALHMVGGREASAGAFRRMRRAGMGLAYDPVAAYGFHRQAGVGMGYGSPQNTIANMQLARARGLEGGAISDFQAQQRHSGGIGGSTTAHAINKALVQGIKLGGFSRALSGEFMSAVGGLRNIAQGSQERTKAGAMSGLLGMTSKALGGAFAQSPQRTAQLLGGLHSTITAPSGGDAGQAFMLRAAGFGKGKSYVQALEQLEKGIGDPTNVKNMVEQTKSERKGGDAQALHLHRLSGGKIKLWQARRLLKMNTSEFTKEGIENAYKAEDTNITGDAARAGKGLGLTKMNIARAQQRAAVASSMMPGLKKMFDIQMAGMKLAVNGFNAAAKKANELAEGFKALKKETEELGGVMGAIRAAWKGVKMTVKEKLGINPIGRSKTPALPHKKDETPDDVRKGGF